MESEIKIFDNEEHLFNSAAQDIIELINSSIVQNNRCTLVLSGGNTPNNLYRIISSKYNNQVNWDKVFIFWGDERCVPPDDNESNYKSARTHLLSGLPVPLQNIFRIPAELSPIEAAEAYEKELKDFFGGLPSFDIMLLGIGNDGHTASIFPNGRAVEEKDKWVTFDYVEKLESWRVTLTLPVINNSKNIFFIVSGSEKAKAVNRIVNDSSSNLPAQKVNPLKGKLFWYLDRNAAVA